MRGRRQPLAERFAEKYQEDETGCWLWTACVNKRTGYGSIGVSGGRMDAHRVAWELAYGGHPCLPGPLPHGLWVLHRCDVRRCVRPDHLFLGNNAVNVRDMFAKGRRSQAGEDNSFALLTRDQVRAIRAATGSRKSVCSRFAAQFGVSYWCIDGVRRGRRWKGV